MASPIQSILNPKSFDEVHKKAGGGPRHDFFAYRDEEFIKHKEGLISQLQAIAYKLQAAEETDLGYVKVSLRSEAWAKSHRPLKALFKPDCTPIVGGTDLGVMIVEALPRTMQQVANNIAQSEGQTKLLVMESHKKEIPFPTAYRSEAGAIESIELYNESDRRDFSLEDALVWLPKLITSSSYEVELFDSPPVQGGIDALDDSHRRMFRSFVKGLKALGNGLTVDRIATCTHKHPLIAVRISRSTASPELRFTQLTQSEHRRAVAPFDPSEIRHQRLLSFLDLHPLVRKISLPGVLVRLAFQQR